MLRQRPGTRLASPLRLLAAVAAALIGLHPGPAGAATALPDSVVVRLPHRDLTVRGVEDAWGRLDPRYRPEGTGTARVRTFVDQLVEKEAMARAALSEPFTMAAAESARYVAERTGLERNVLYRVLVADSVRVTEADRDSARRAAAALPDSLPAAAAANSPEAIERDAFRRAEQRRTMEVDAAIRRSLEPAWDDSVAALLARGYAAIGDTSLPDLSNPFAAATKDRRPKLAPADTVRVLVTSTVGPISAAEFVRRFALLNPLQSPLPTTPGTVKARGEQFLGQMWFDAEVKRRRIAEDPEIVATMADKRESIALDHWYARHVRAAIDTSEAAMRAHYAKDPQRYAVGAHALIHHWVVEHRATADSLVAVLAAGTPWDSLCARFANEPSLKDPCGHVFTIAEDTPDSALVANLKALAPGRAYVRPEPGGAPGFRVVQLVERKPMRLRPFEEARTFVGRDLAAVQAEDLVVAKMAELVRAMPKTVNESALARVRLAP